jgi:poly-gamma-glutamate biosynthesis protein PgsC/CapC
MILTEAIALGLLFSLWASETMGFIAGGLVVPGYFVVISSDWMVMGATLAAGFLAYGVLKLLTRFMLIYGRRRLLVAVLLGFLFSELSRQLYVLEPSPLLLRLQAFGFVIPGLLAYWMDRQGIAPTLGMLMVDVLLVRQLLILFHGGRPLL